MRTRSLACAGLLLALGSWTSRGAEAATRTLPPAMAALVPPDAVGLLVLSSAAEAAADLAVLQAGMGAADSAQIRAAFLLAMLTRPLGLDAGHLDAQRSLAIAMSLPANLAMGVPPALTYVLPATDLAGVRADLAAGPASGAAPVVSGEYVGISTLPDYQLNPQPARITVDLPARAAALRLYAAEVLTMLRPMLEAGLTQMSHANPALASPDSSALSPQAARQLAAFQQMQAAMFRAVLDALAATNVLDVGLELVQGQMEAEYRMDLAPGAAPLFCLPATTAGLADLTRCLPREYPIVSLQAWDYAKLAELSAPWYRAMAEGAAQPDTPFGMSASRTQAMLELQRRMGGQVLCAIGWGETGLEAVGVCTADDPAGYLQALRAGVGAGPLAGVRETIAAGPVVAGVSTVLYTLQPDAQAIAAMSATAGVDTTAAQREARESAQVMRVFFGQDTIVFQLAAVEDKVVMCLGEHPDVLEHMIGALRSRQGALPPALEALDPQARDRLCAWGRLDLRATLLPALERLLELEPDAQAEQVATALRNLDTSPWSLESFHGDDQLHGRFRVDFAGLQKLMSSMPRPPAHRPGDRTLDQPPTQPPDDSPDHPPDQ